MTERVVMVSLANPKGNMHGGAIRLRGFASALEASGCEVEEVQVPQAPTGEGGSSVWQLVGRTKRALFPLPMVRPSAAAEVTVRITAPRTIVFSSVPTVTYALAAAGQTIHWADYHDLPARFAHSEAMVRTGPTRMTALAQARVLARHHERAVKSSVITTYAGYGDYRAAGGGHDSLWIPPVVTRVEVPAEPRMRPRVAGFLANFDYWPNVDALKNLTTRWLGPLQRSGLEVVIAGFGAERLEDLPPGVRNLGPLPTLADFYAQVDIVLVPVRRGSGIKVKAMEGLLSGRPVLVDPHVLDGFPDSYADVFDVFDGRAINPVDLVHRAASRTMAVERAADEFSWGRQRAMVDGLLDHLRRQFPRAP